MKKLLLGLFLLASALSFAAGRVLRDKEAEFKDGVVYVKGENKAYTGTLEGYNERGVLEARKEFKNGKMDGSSKIFYPNGKVLSEATFKDGNQVGVQKITMKMEK